MTFKGLKTSVLVLCAAGFFFTAGGIRAAEKTVTGAGSTFVYPVLSQWAYAYHKKTGLKLAYQSIGSGGGIAQIKARTVDFGASDAPMKKPELDKLGLMQWPVIMGGVVPVVHLRGVKPGEIKLTPELLADIYLGKITKWNDPALKKANPGVALPDMGITVVHRSDGSGTTWIFTNYLAKVSKTWASKVGNAKSVAWPVGVGGKGNEGVASYVQRINGAVGYVEFAYALQNHMTYVLLQNRAGRFVQPTMQSFMAAAANADWNHAPGFYMVLTDQPGAKSWPITGATVILFYKNQMNASKAHEILNFFNWCYKSGQGMAKKLDYVPIPDNVVNLIESKWKAEIRSNGKSVWK
jgi:phosphate transport system substrate-binding protein